MWNAGVGTTDFDQINESEAQVNYESRKNKNLPCEAVYKFKMSNSGESLVIWWSVRIAGAVSSATYESHTPSESDAAESGTRKRGKTKCKDTKTQVHDVKVSDMLMMKPPKLWKMALDDRVRGMLQSESSSKGKGKK